MSTDLSNSGAIEDPTSTDGPTRRRFLAGLGAGVGAAAVAGPITASLSGGTASAAAATGVPTTDRSVTLDQGTDIAAQVSPDGRHIAFDLLGVLWVMPVAGGTAHRLTGDLADIGQPEWSPDSAALAFQSYRDGVFNLWTVRADGSGLRQHTYGPYDHREPRWSPDGRSLVYSSDANGSYGIFTHELASGRVATVTDVAGSEEYEPAWSPDGSRIAFVVDNTAIDVIDVRTGVRTTAVTAAASTDIFHMPAWTPDGQDLIYTLISGRTSTLQISGKPLVTDEECFPFRVSFLDRRHFVYTADGHIRRRPLGGQPAHTIGFAATVTTRTPGYTKRRRDFDSPHRYPVIGIGSPVLSPDGDSVAFRALNDIWTMRIGERPVPLTRDHWWKSDPAFSPDGRTLSYSSDRAGKLDIWLRDLRTGRDRQLTDLPGAAAVSGSWSRDGREIAFLDQTGALWTVEVRTGDMQRVFPATFEPGRPTWGPHGDVIALAAIKPYSARYREGLSEVLLVNRRTGAATYVPALANRSIQTRGDDGPVWSPDGTKMAFAVASVLYVVGVDADGIPHGTPRQLTHEVTDAISWAGDSRTLSYLTNGTLKTVRVDGSHRRTIAVPMTWQNMQVRSKTVIHAGRVWDGTSRHLQADRDIVLDGHRIVAVEPHRSGRDGHRVDASRSVVMPGLVDIHNHREMQGYSYGDRQGRLWLSLGVTTTRSPGSPAYHMVEDRESVQSGKRIAPRYFATGEAVDGARIYYNFMRPTFSSQQLALELARAAALDYDLMKAYVRLPPDWQQQVIDFAHSRQIPATSHYHYPATAFGGDGMEHIGATNRFGYSRTVTALGTGYDDVADLFDASQMRRTPTLFGAAALFGEDDSLAHDHRVRTLYPSWELGTLDAAVTLAKTTDQSVQLADLKRQVEQIIDMLAHEGNIVTGTDSPIDHTAVSTHMNLRAMVKYGITPYEALLTATSACGEFLGEPLGQVQPGMYADLVVLGGNPLADIHAAADVQQVFVSGVRHTLPDLLRPFTVGEQAEPTVRNKMLPAVPDHPSTAAYWWHDAHYLETAKRSCCVS